jgi:hypothetical protein
VIQRKNKDAEIEDEVTEDDVRVPLSTLVHPKETVIRITHMERYWDVFFVLEYTVLCYVADHSRINDEDILDAYRILEKSFDDLPEGSLALEISKAVKAVLIARKREKKRMYTLGEVRSCVLYLLRIGKQHHSSDGIGYLKWICTFFEGGMPMTHEENLDYIIRNEL